MRQYVDNATNQLFYLYICRNCANTLRKKRDKSTALPADEYNFRRFVENKRDKPLHLHADETKCVQIEKLPADKSK